MNNVHWQMFTFTLYPRECTKLHKFPPNLLVFHSPGLLVKVTFSFIQIACCLSLDIFCNCVKSTRSILSYVYGTFNLSILCYIYNIFQNHKWKHCQGQSGAQHLCYNILWQIVTCYILLPYQNYILQGSAAQLWPWVRKPSPKVFFHQPVCLPPPPHTHIHTPGRGEEGWGAG